MSFSFKGYAKTTVYTTVNDYEFNDIGLELGIKIEYFADGYSCCSSECPDKVDNEFISVNGKELDYRYDEPKFRETVYFTEEGLPMTGQEIWDELTETAEFEFENYEPDDLTDYYDL